MLDERMFQEIRNIVVEQSKQEPNHGFHVISNLNWHRYEEQIKSALQCLPSRGKVLDVGCGWGHTTAMLAASRPDLEFVGIDMLEAPSWAKLERYGARFIVCNALAIPFESEFETVIAFGVMEHTDDEKRFLNQVNKSLKTSGCLIIFNLPNKYALSEWLAGVLGLWSHEHKYTMAQIKELLKATDFNVTSMKREFIVPAQVDRVSRRLGSLFNKHYILLDKLDSWLAATPFRLVAESWTIYAKRS